MQQSGLLVPQKSCSGIYLAYNRDDIKEIPGCISCIGNRMGCQSCRVKRKIIEERDARNM